VLSDSSSRVPADRAAATAHHHAGASADHAASAAGADSASEACRPIQLRRWFRELAGRLECSEEGVVLPRSREGLPQPGRRWVCYFLRALRLQCRICQLDARLVGREEGMVLLQQGQGLSPGCWWMCLIFGLRAFLSICAGPSKCHLPAPLTGPSSRILAPEHDGTSAPALAPSSGVEHHSCASRVVILRER